MRTDTLFYQLFLTFPNLLFEILNQPPLSGYKFSSKEIKELARSFDGIFLPPEDETDKLIYFVEVQYQKKDYFWWRFMTEIFVYFGQYQPVNDWQAVALFKSRKIDSGLPIQYQSLLEGGKIKIFYLNELEIPEDSSIALDLIALTVSQDSEAISIAQKAFRKSQQKQINAEKQTKVLELIQTALIYKLNNLTKEEIEAMFTYDQLKDTRYFQDIKREGKIEGKIEGKLEGKIEGKIEGKLETVPLLIQLGMTVEEIADRLNLPLEEVKKVVETNNN